MYGFISCLIQIDKQSLKFNFPCLPNQLLNIATMDDNDSKLEFVI